MEKFSCEKKFDLSKCFRNCVQSCFCGNNNKAVYYHKTDCRCADVHNVISIVILYTTVLQTRR